MPNTLKEQIDKVAREGKFIMGVSFQTVRNIVENDFALAERILQKPDAHKSPKEVMLELVRKSIITNLARHGYIDQAREAAIRYEGLESQYAV